MKKWLFHQFFWKLNPEDNEFQLQMHTKAIKAAFTNILIPGPQESWLLWFDMGHREEKLYSAFFELTE